MNFFESSDFEHAPNCQVLNDCAIFLMFYIYRISNISESFSLILFYLRKPGGKNYQK